MRMLVTGTAGFIGLNAAQHLSTHGVKWWGIDRIRPAIEQVANRTSNVDLLDASRLHRVLSDFQPTVILHLAARTDLQGRALRDYPDNTLAVSNLLEAMHRLPQTPNLIHASSRLVFKPDQTPLSDWDYSPHTWYGESKVVGEMIVRGMKPEKWAIVRPTSIWGPYFGTPYRQFFEAILKRRYVHASGVRVQKTMGYVGNTVHQLTTLADRFEQASGEAHLLGDSEPVDIGAWANHIAATARVNPPLTVPRLALQGAATAGSVIQGLTRRSMPITRFRLENLYESVTYDTTSIHAIAPNDPIPLHEATAQTLSWLTRCN